MINFIEAELLKDIKNKIILDYCCCGGIYTILPALRGAFVHGIDISDKSLEIAKARAKHFNVADKTFFYMMDAENLEFADNTFDIILSYDSLSFLDLSKAYSELARVLKKDGKVIIVDTLGHNPILNLNRKKYIKSGSRQKYHYDNIMTIKRIRNANRYFGNSTVKFFDLFTLLAVPIEKLKKVDFLANVLKRIDNIVLKIPILNLLADE